MRGLEFPEAEATRGGCARQHLATLGSTPSKGSLPASGTSSNARASPQPHSLHFLAPGIFEIISESDLLPCGQDGPLLRLTPNISTWRNQVKRRCERFKEQRGPKRLSSGLDQASAEEGTLDSSRSTARQGSAGSVVVSPASD